jgi:hypothetical protein
MIRVYVAGAYSGPDVLSVLNNMRIGMRAAKDVLVAGMAPFCPWLDYQFFLLLRDDEQISLDSIYGYSMAWLEASSAVYVVQNPANVQSRGTQQELAKAKELHLPIFNDLQHLIAWAERKRIADRANRGEI